jgi:hypothetical protein
MNSRKSRAFKFFERVPVVRDTGEPQYAGIFFLFVCAVLGALIVLGHSTGSYSRVLQTAGGALVVLGVYLTIVGLRASRAEQYASRLMTAIGQLSSESEAVRLGTIRLLEALLVEAPELTGHDLARVARYKLAVIETLDAISRTDNANEAALALEVSRSVTVTVSDARSY